MTDKQNFHEFTNNDDPIICEQCLEEWPIMIMLKKDLWLSIAKKEEFLCKGCIEERLDRCLTGWDLQDVPVNHMYWRKLMYEVIQHTSYAESYRRMILESRFDPFHTLLGLVRGYLAPSVVGFDNEDLLHADRELMKEKEPDWIRRARIKFGWDEPANDNSGLDQSTG